MPLTEVVEVCTLSPERHKLDKHAHLERGNDGLPMLVMDEILYTHATFPAAWFLRAPRNTWPGVLLTAWQEIEHIIEEIAIAEREDDNERDQAHQCETDARISEEVERQRGEHA